MSTLYLTNVNEAVQKSVSQGKPLVVVISDNTPESNSWSDSMLSNKKAHDLIKQYTVVLKLVKPSQEYDFFSQIFPNPPVSTIYVIKDGKLAAIVTTEASEDDLVRHVTAVADTDKSRDLDTATSKKTQKSSQQYGSMKEQYAQESASRYKTEQLRKKQLEKEERERVLRLVQWDKKERELSRHAGGSSATALSSSSSSSDQVTPSHVTHTSKPIHSSCTLQFRLLNGNKLQHQFQSSQTLMDVRDWVDHNRSDGDTPYVFYEAVIKKSYDITDETKSLASLDLVPRSVLVLKPETNYTSAYSGGWLTSLGNVLYSAWYGKNESSKAAEEHVTPEPPQSAIHSSNVSNDDLTSFHSTSSAMNGSVASLNDFKGKKEKDKKDKKVVYNGNQTNLEDDKDD